MPSDDFPAADPQPQTDADALGAFLAAWLAQAPPTLVETLRLAALLHGFDPALLSGLRDSPGDTAVAIAQLERTGLLVAESSGWYAVPSSLREMLLQWWREGNRAGYRALSARIAALYAARLPGAEDYQVAYVYHALGAGDGIGIDALVTAFEQAWSARRLGTAERLLRCADEQAPVLSSDALTWLRYLHARLDIAYNRYYEAASVLQRLAVETLDARLRVKVLVSLADVSAQVQRWTEALEHYEEAVRLYAAQEDRLGGARALEAQGMVYVQLATSLGGLHQQEPAVRSRRQAWWHTLSHAPFLAYRWLSRRVTWLPNLYFGTDYQDWIIVRLLYNAIHCFDRARERVIGSQTTTGAGGEALAADLQIRLADLYQRVDQWSRAEQQFARLADIPAVRTDDYRQATLRLAQGRAASGRRQLDVASQHLAAARTVFERYGDQRALAAVLRLQGDVASAAQDPDGAATFYIASGQAAVATDDLLAATDIAARLAAMREAGALSGPAKAEVDAWEQGTDRRAYIARFPGELQKRFCQLGAYLVLPLTYLAIFRLTQQMIDVSTLLETIYLAVPIYAFPLMELISSLLVLLVMPITTVWLYELLYVLGGWIFVRQLPLRHIARCQPDYVVTLPDGIMVQGENGRVQEATWPAVETWASLDQSLWRSTIDLFSRTILIAGSVSIVLTGIVSHYGRLQADVERRLERSGQRVARRCFDFLWLRDRWMLLAIALTLVMAGVALFGVLDPEHELIIWSVLLSDGEWRDLPLTSVAYQFNVWALYFFPLVGLVRLMLNRRGIRKALRGRLPVGGDWALWLALAVLVFLIGQEIWWLAA